MSIMHVRFVRKGSLLVPISSSDQRFGTARDASGRITFGLKAGCRRIFCDPSGNDSNSGLNPSAAVATNDKAATIYNDSNFKPGDQLMYAGKAGRTYNDTGAFHSVVNKSGDSLQYPCALISYDPTDALNEAKYGYLLGADRPRINIPGIAGWDVTQASAFSVATPNINNIAYQGLEFITPLSSTSIGASAGMHNGICLQHCVFNKVFYGFDIDETATKTSWGQDFLVSQCAGLNQWNSTGNASWMYISGTKVFRIEDCAGAHCGWNPAKTRLDDDVSLGAAYHLGHQFYYSATNDGGIFNRLIAIDPPQDGFSFRGEHNATCLVSLDAATPGSFGGFSNPTYTDERPQGMLGSWIDFTFMGGENIRPSEPLAYGPGADNCLPGSKLQNGVMFDNPNYGGTNNYAWTSGQARFGTSTGTPEIDQYLQIINVRWRNFAPVFEAPGGSYPNRIHNTYSGCIGDNLSSRLANTSVDGTNSTWSSPPAGYKTRDQVITAVLTAAGVTPGADYVARKKQLSNIVVEYPHLAGEFAKAINTIGLQSLGLNPITHAVTSVPDISSLPAPRAQF